VIGVFVILLLGLASLSAPIQRKAQDRGFAAISHSSRRDEL